MPVSDTYKLTFIHIPKTAGTTIEKLIGTATKEEGWIMKCGSPQHRFASEYKDNNYFTFTVVRNPYDRMISEYHYRKVDEDINTFIKTAIKTSDSIKWDRHILPQSKFVDMPNINIFKYENLNKLFKLLEGIIDLPIPKATLKTYEKYILSNKSIDLINNYYSEDFSRFNYNKL